ncbi:hypothetical protein [Sphingomonas yabuuchiae]|uniref:Uncharacterized protein n=2 Tax=Sphingomonas yabuuchiae TaxID=172044 RepID=A0AA40ZY48_9SPHN|nr:hypothetical protein [Sphingomonas yabuuchiae]MBN3558558.1 hypothetical protein [Sphingomonas yabuuchiae]
MLSTRNSMFCMGIAVMGQEIDQAAAIMVERTAKNDRGVSCRSQPTLRRCAAPYAEADGFPSLKLDVLIADRDISAVRAAPMIHMRRQ